MHLIKDENGNLIQHGHEHVHEHTHEHTHADGVTHSHAHTHELSLIHIFFYKRLQELIGWEKVVKSIQRDGVLYTGIMSVKSNEVGYAHIA